MQAREKDNRRDWIIVLLIILIGLLCIMLAGGWALRLTPSWRLDSNMGSNLDPNSDFLTARSNGFLEPIDSSILTQPAWMSLYLTPGAIFETGTPVPTIVKNTPLPPATQTSFATPTIIPATRTNTPAIIINPTNTSVVNTPAPTRTFTPSPIPTVSADLSITLTDGSATYTPGGTLTYTIVVRNTSGPSPANGATVTDTFPAALTGITWTCTGSAGGTCPASGSGNINHTVNLPVGSFVTYTVNVTVSAAATGNLVNMASVAPPASVPDPAMPNNTATDTDTPAFNVDLQITKTDGITTYTPGTSTTYTIVVANAGPANAIGATVTDAFLFPGTQMTGATWTCVAAGGATCTANGTGNINETVDIPVGGTLTYTALASISSAAVGNLLNTATITAPAGYIETTPGNNSTTDTNTPTPNADLSVTKTDNATVYTANTTKIYSITVFNAGPSDVTGATLTDTFLFPGTQMTGATWSCVATGGAVCTTNGSGNINDPINVPVGSSVTYTVNATTVAAPTGDLTNTASVSLPVGYTDSAPGNNSATDTDTLIVTDPTPGEVGPTPDGNIYNLVAGGTLTQSINIVVNGHASWDLVYYERPAGSGILLDWMVIEISDGQNWYQVFNWGNNVADTNSNMDFNILPFPAMAPFPPPEEADQRDIPSARLYNLTGIAINLDGVVPPGTYSFIRFYAPPGDVDGQTEIDAIQVLP